MSASIGTTVVESAATASASAPQPQVWVKTGTLAASARASAPAPTVIIGPSVIGYVAVKTYVALPPSPDPGYHVGGHDLIGIGAEVILVAAFLIVGAEIVVVRRVFHL